ncbi:MAG: peptide deformylase [Proteobacteria bacterium]|nr:peptide deformylase [Pseudomonadota bacterium]MBU1710036.1 peptide deformylase [Pseudomonadota bacterium]
MAVRKIITYPDPVLRNETKPVTEFGEDLKQLVEDMAETMYHAPGVGLAANQIGVCEKVVVIDIAPHEEKNQFIVLVNPTIIAQEGEEIDEEGCLSVIDYAAKVKRFTRITVKAQDIEGDLLEFDAQDFFARVIQHELDHLDGKLFIDRISSIKRALYKKKLKKIIQKREEDSDD